jgi:very-short-patch-repair endonuclease
LHCEFESRQTHHMSKTLTFKRVKLKYDWVLIQKKIDEGYSYRNLHDEFGTHDAAIASAKKLGLIKTRSHKEAAKLYGVKNIGKKHSEETKKKLSLIRKEYLANNPDKVPYRLNHSSKESYPEKLFREALEKENIIGWVQEYKFGVYQFDFAFPELKIDIEIDGQTHNLPKVQKIDAERDEKATSAGWKVIRFSADKVKKDIENCIIIVKNCLHL